MADFKTHLTFSTTIGVAYGGAAFGLFHLPPQTCILAGGLCSVSGMLPDIDSNSGRPLRESLAFMAAIVPMMLADRFRSMGVTPETTVMAGALVYVAIRFGLGYFLKHYTVHRGMFHSLPAVVIFGELAFLLASGEDTWLRAYKAGGVVTGYLSHLLLDEIYSVEWRGWMRIKKSFGTAIKVYSPKSLWPNLSAYIKLGLLSYLVFYEPGWMNQYREERAERWSRQAVQQPAEADVVQALPLKEKAEQLQEEASESARRILDSWQR